MNKIKNLNVPEKVKEIILIMIGSCLLALSNTIFIVPFDIVKGGMTSIAMMISNLLMPITGINTTDIVLWVINIILWFVALFLIGKKFAMSTLVGTIAYSTFFNFIFKIKFS